MLLLLIGLQDPPAQTPEPSVERKFKAKSQESFRVELTTFGKEEQVRHDYTMVLKYGPQPGADGEWPVDVVLTNLTSLVAGKEIKQMNFGSMTIAMGATGAPKLLTFLSTTLPFSLPLLAFSLPDTDALSFDYVSPTYDRVISFRGPATVKPGVEMTVSTSARLHIAGEPRDDSMFRKFSMTSVFDRKDGSLTKANGKYVANDGTVNYRLTRIRG